MHTPPRRPFRVVIDLNLSSCTAQNHLRGILRFARERGWETSIAQRREDGVRGLDPRRLEADGVLAGRGSPAGLEHAAIRRGVPLVAFDARVKRGAAASLLCDNASVARLAAGHLLSRGFREFAFVGEENGIAWSRERLAAFRRELAARGLRCAAYPLLPAARRADLAFAKADLGAWLARLPRPCAVFAAYDIRARHVLEAARAAGLGVPSDVAVIGVDDDPLLCETASPAITSIAMDTEDAGYRAAAALDEAMRGRRPAEPVVLFRGVRVVARASTARFVGSDPLVARARAAIASPEAAGLTVAALLARLGVSRRTLELRFRAETGTTPGRAIAEAKLDRARDLLRDTALPQEKIAAACGFCDASHMGHLFRRRFGAPPSRFRH
ncbi:MAG: substrate-binding domain-containing protein [Kiritimatiellae bacterium]|nr:substrate-binding domain-containing protein [Kiritimatiellia bacterium]